MVVTWFYIAGSLCFLVGSILSLTINDTEDEEDEAEPFGFTPMVQDSGVVDGGEPDYESWE